MGKSRHRNSIYFASLLFVAFLAVPAINIICSVYDSGIFNNGHSHNAVADHSSHSHHPDAVSETHGQSKHPNKIVPGLVNNNHNHHTSGESHSTHSHSGHSHQSATKHSKHSHNQSVTKEHHSHSKPHQHKQGHSHQSDSANEHSCSNGSCACEDNCLCTDKDNCCKKSTTEFYTLLKTTPPPFQINLNKPLLAFSILFVETVNILTLQVANPAIFFCNKSPPPKVPDIRISIQSFII